MIRSLSTPKFAKNATKLLLDYELNINDFPELQAIVDKNSSTYFIRRAFKAVGSPDYMPYYKVEDLLRGQPRMLGFLVEELCKQADK